MAKPNPAVILVDISGSVGMPGHEGVRHPHVPHQYSWMKETPPEEPGRLHGHGWLYEAALVRDLMHTLEQTGADIHVYDFGSQASEVDFKNYVSPLKGYDYVPLGTGSATNPERAVELAKKKVKGPVDLFVITDGHFHHESLEKAIGSWASKVTILQFNAARGVESYQIFPKEYGWEVKQYAAETKKQSRPKVKGVVNPKGITQVFGTPIDFKALPEKISINRRLSNGKFKLEAHYPAKHYNDKQNYIGKRKEGSYCRFYDNKSPFFIARTVWDAASQPGMHMMVKNRGETHRFIVTPKVDDPSKASVIGSYLVHRDNGDPVLCSGVIGELEAVGDDGDFKVIPYKNHGIRCPKFDSDKNELAGHIPQTFEYKKSTKPRGPRKTAADYCKPKHSFKHPTDIKKAEMVAAMDDELDDEISCLDCAWDGTYEDLIFIDADGSGGGGYDFVLACPLCESDEWLDDMMEAEGHDEPCFSCDGIGHWDDGDCSYCAGSGLMSDTLRAEMALYDSEYFDADCGCFKKVEGNAESFGAEGKEQIKTSDWVIDYEWKTNPAKVPTQLNSMPDSWTDYQINKMVRDKVLRMARVRGRQKGGSGTILEDDGAGNEYEILYRYGPTGFFRTVYDAETEIKIYSFKELSEEAQTKAVADYIEGWEETHEMGDMEYLDALSVLKYDYPMDGLDHYKKDGTFVTPEEAYGADGKKNCGCGKDPCITYGAEGSGEITKRVSKDFYWETEPHPHEHDDLIDEGYVNEEMKGVMEEALNDGNTDSWVGHTHYTTDDEGQDVEIEVSGVFRAEDEVPRWAKPLGLIAGLAAGYISAQMINNAKE